MLVTHDVREDNSGLHLPLGGYCGLRYDADNGAAGAGFAWVPHTLVATPYECADASSYRNHLLDQLEFAVRHLSGFTDAYDGAYPPCNAGGDPSTWFPRPWDCMSDPDWSACGQTNCDTGYLAHVFDRHWIPGRAFVGNHCLDGVMDYGESDVDIGGNCLP